MRARWQRDRGQPLLPCWLEDLIVAFWVLRTTVSRGLEVGYPSAALGSEDWCNPVHGGVFSDGRPSVHGVAFSDCPG